MATDQAVREVSDELIDAILLAQEYGMTATEFENLAGRLWRENE